MQDNIRLRTAFESDIHQMLPILKQLFEMENVAFDSKKQQIGLSMIIKEKSSEAFVAENSERIIGMCTLQTIVSTATGGLSGYIEDFCVDNTYRGQGIGSKILEFAENWSKENNIPNIFLLTNSSNKKTLEFYEKNHWKKTNYLAFTKSL
jgi:ribosomal protein S18 acetylase RimI-like enzyme